MSYPAAPICRICLSNDELQVSLYSEYAQRRALLTKIRVCLPIKISPGDTLPVTICSQCIERLDQFYDYYCKSETSQRILTEGDVNMDARYRRRSLAHNHDKGTPSTKGQNRTKTSILPDVINGSDTMNQEIEKILSQSPQVTQTAAAGDGLCLNRNTDSPGSAMSILHNVKKKREKNHTTPKPEAV